MASKKSARAKIVTDRAMTCFLKVFVPELTLDKKKKQYSVSLLWAKESPAGKHMLALFREHYNKLTKEVFGHAPKMRPLLPTEGKSDKAVIKDGDEKYANCKEDKKDTYKAYKGCWYIQLYREEKDGPPPVFDRNKNPIINPSEFQSGDFARAIITMSCYENSYGPQVTLQFDGIQYLEEGEHFGGRMSEEEAAGLLDDLADDMDV